MPELNQRMFFILAFGKGDVDNVYDKVYAPSARALGFEPIRIDRKDDGRTKLDQIFNEIQLADLVVTDLTYERPNCYFELGYARGTRRHEEVILCARRDHVDHGEYSPPSGLQWNFPHSIGYILKPRHEPPKVHFDLAGFDILTWESTRLSEFQQRFRGRIQERQSLVNERKPIPEETSPAPTTSEAERVEKVWRDLETTSQNFKKYLESK